jgi:hypothetical protein
MSRISTPTDDAIASIAAAISTIERREAALGKRVARLLYDRKQFLTQKVEVEFLPAINHRVLSGLRLSLPAFVTPVVEQAFAENRKFLGLFAGAGYMHALTLLRTRLASHLERIGYGSLAGLEVEIGQVRAEIAVVNAKGREANDMLRLLQQARDRQVPLPQDVLDNLSTISQNARAGRERRRSAPSGNTAPSEAPLAAANGTSDDSDLWLYLLTDVPTSFRTMLYNAVFEHRHDQVGDQRHGGDHPASPGGHDDGQPEGDEGGAHHHHSHHGHDTSAETAGAAAFIAIDDSLGAYS